MKTQVRIALGLVVLMILAGGLTLLYIDPSAPIAIHWNYRGEVDNAASALVALSIPPLSALLIVGLMASLRFLEPRKENLQRSMKAVGAIALVVTGLMTVMQGIFIAEALGTAVPVVRIVIAATGIVVAVVGNYMTKVRSNFFVGIRTPWTLSSEEVWRKTHRLGGPLFVIAGVLIAISAWILPLQSMPVFIGIALGTAAIVPLVYSWFAWRSERRSAGPSL